MRPGLEQVCAGMERMEGWGWEWGEGNLLEGVVTWMGPAGPPGRHRLTRPFIPCGSRSCPEPWGPGERLEQGPAEAPQVPTQEAHAADAAGEGLHQRYRRGLESERAAGGPRRGGRADLPLPQTRCSAARWPRCVSARGARCRASCSSASAPSRPAVRTAVRGGRGGGGRIQGAWQPRRPLGGRRVERKGPGAP